MKTEELIVSLAQEKPIISKMEKPINWFLKVMIFVVLYYALSQALIGFRNDLPIKINQPIFVIELFLMAYVLFSLLAASLLMAYPDSYQKNNFVKIANFSPIILVIFYASSPLWQSLEDIAIDSSHKIECAICIVVLSIIPTLFLFYQLRKGATLSPIKAGIISSISASMIACIALRLAEVNDQISHLIIWHYLPILVISAVGALIGSKIFRW